MALSDCTSGLVKPLVSFFPSVFTSDGRLPRCLSVLFPRDVFGKIFAISSCFLAASFGDLDVA